MAVTLERGGGELRLGPFLVGRVEVGVDGSRLNVVDRDAPGAYPRANPWVNIFTAPLVTE